jgi:hypothetical protein
MHKAPPLLQKVSFFDKVSLVNQKGQVFREEKDELKTKGLACELLVM